MPTLEALRDYGADVDRGLARCMNMESFYLNLFDLLKGDTKAEELKAALDANDLDRAFETAHAMKGAYANLELTPILRPVSEITEHLRAREQMDYSGLMAEILAEKQKLDALL